MSITKPPCFNEQTRTDCPRRYVGCRDECEDWRKWERIHAQETKQIKRRKECERAYMEVSAGFAERSRRAAQRDYEERKRRM